MQPSSGGVPSSQVAEMQLCTIARRAAACVMSNMFGNFEEESLDCRKCGRIQHAVSLYSNIAGKLSDGNKA